MPITVVTDELIEFAKANHLKYTAAEMDRMFGVSKGVTRRIYTKYGIVVPKELTHKLRAAKLKKPFTPEDDEFIRQNIETKAYKTIAKLLNRSSNKVLQRCYELGFSDLMKAKSKSTCFKPGHEPLNKGTRMSEELKEKMKHTFFKKGHIPHNTKEDGSISIRADNRNVPYLFFRVSMGKWIPLHTKIWEDANGPVPKDHVITYINKNTMDCRLENLMCITKEENMLRNSIHQYPEELKTQIRKVAKLKRIINKKSETL